MNTQLDTPAQPPAGASGLDFLADWRNEGDRSRRSGNCLVRNERERGGILLQAQADCTKVKAHWKKRNSWCPLFGNPAKERGFTARPAFLAEAQRNKSARPERVLLVEPAQTRHYGLVRFVADR